MRPHDSTSIFDHVPDLGGALFRRTTRDLIADKIAGLIAAGILQVGDVLPGERDLAGTFRVSRETVRGAIRQLATRGIIEVAQGARTRVVSDDVGSVNIGLHAARRVNGYDIEAVHAARLLVELPVVAAATVHIDRQTLAFLRESLDAQREAADDPVRFLICDREFHLTIYRTAGNPALADFVSDLYLHVMEHRRRAVAQPGAILHSYEDHLAIVAGLESGDSEAVVAAFRTHLDRIYRTTLGIMASRRNGDTAFSKAAVAALVQPRRKR